MSKRILLLSIFILAGAGLHAQSSITMDSLVRYWDQGPLSYSDLSARSSELPTVSEFQYGISWTTKEDKIGNTTIRVPHTRTYMNPFSSWVHPDFRTDAMLQYIQTGFDYVEICRRRAMKDQRSSSFGTESVMKFHLDVADSFLAKMKDETDQGLDTAAVRDYAARVRQELEHTEDFHYSDMKVYPRGFGIGMHCGIGSEFYSGTLSDYVWPLVGFDFGLAVYAVLREGERCKAALADLASADRAESVGAIVDRAQRRVDLTDAFLVQRRLRQLRVASAGVGSVLLRVHFVVTHERLRLEAGRLFGETQAHLDEIGAKFGEFLVGKRPCGVLDFAARTVKPVVVFRGRNERHDL